MSKVQFVQFGEGGFLRGFVDWMIDKMNKAGVLDAKVAVVQPIPQGMCDLLAAQNGVYTHIIRGAEGVEISKIDVIDSCVNPFTDYDAYLKLAENPDLRFVVSNTTEAGIVFTNTDKMENTPNVSFPAKLTLFMLHRYQAGLNGLIFLPCELIDRNGDNLKKAILQYCDLWQLDGGFIRWIKEENIFCNTLVDRINTGYPKDETIDLDYEDKLINTSEYFHLWVIETEHDLEAELPFSKAGLNVIVTKDALERYRTRKVRLLNGAHTSMVAHALLSGLETVKDCMDDDAMCTFINTCLFEEIIPTLDLPKSELVAYANDVLTRFSNPYIKHYLASISLNSISKFKVRVLPSILEYKKRFGHYPKNLIYGFARLLEFYRIGTPNDDPAVIAFIRSHFLDDILANTDFWGQDLSDMKEVLSHAITSSR